MPNKPSTVSSAAVALGRQGGKSGTGKAKRRGSKNYYKELGRAGGYAKASANKPDKSNG